MSPDTCNYWPRQMQSSLRRQSPPPPSCPYPYPTRRAVSKEIPPHPRAPWGWNSGKIPSEVTRTVGVPLPFTASFKYLPRRGRRAATNRYRYVNNGRLPPHTAKFRRRRPQTHTYGQPGHTPHAVISVSVYVCLWPMIISGIFQVKGTPFR